MDGEYRHSHEHVDKYRPINSIFIPNRVNPARKPRVFETIGQTNARPCGQFLLANAPPPVPTMMVKCPAPQSIPPIYKILVAVFQ